MRSFRRFAAALLALVLAAGVFCAAGCGKEDGGAIVGVWKSEPINIGEELGSVMTEVSPEYGEFYDFSGLEYQLSIEFAKDGTYRQFVDEESADALAGMMFTAFCEGMTRQFESMASDSDLTADEIIALSGYETIEELVSESLDIRSFASSFTDFRKDGNYTVSGGVYYLSESLDEKPKLSKESMTAAITGDVLTIIPSENSAKAGEKVKFTRQ